MLIIYMLSFYDSIEEDEEEEKEEEEEDEEGEEEGGAASDDDSDDDDSDDDDDDDTHEDDKGNVSKWKESLAERTLARKPPSLMQLVYGESTKNSTSMNENNDSSEDEETGGDFFKPIEEVKKQNMKDGLDDRTINAEDCSKCAQLMSQKWEKDNEEIHNRFVSGNLAKASLRNSLQKANTEEEDEDVYGDFEDLETGENYELYQTEDGFALTTTQKGVDSEAEERRLKKLALRAKFDSQYTDDPGTPEEDTGNEN